MSRSRTERIKVRARELGFELVGVAPLEPVPELAFYREWVTAGYAGQMGYLERNLEKRLDPAALVPDARSVIVCAAVYHTDHPLSVEETEPGRGWISRYAWGDDYHEVLKGRLDDLLAFIEAESSEEVAARVYVDTGPVLDRVYAKYAGLGWFGKNTCLINQELGSWLFLGEIITNLELEYDTPAPDRCGTCNRCLEACPTDALLAPYVLDARRCISYLTIELRGALPEDLREPIGRHVFGCDICQDVCPWNRKAARTAEPVFQPRPGLVNPDLAELAQMTPEAFRERFRRSPVKRSKYTGFLRNVAVAMGNSGTPRFRPYLEALAEHEDAMVADHARWALQRLLKTEPNGVEETVPPADAPAEA